MLAKFKATMSGYIKTIQGHELEIEEGSEYEVRFNGPVILINDYIYGTNILLSVGQSILNNGCVSEIDFSSTFFMLHQFGYFEGLYVYFIESDISPADNLYIVKNENPYHRFSSLDKHLAPYGVFTTCISSKDINENGWWNYNKSVVSFISKVNFTIDDYEVIHTQPSVLITKFNCNYHFNTKGIYHLKEDVVITSSILHQTGYIRKFMPKGSKYHVELENLDYAYCKLYIENDHESYIFDIHDLLEFGYIDILGSFYYPCKETDLIENLDSLFYRKHLDIMLYKKDIMLYKKTDNFKLRECNFSKFEGGKTDLINIRPLKDLLRENYVLNTDDEFNEVQILFLYLYYDNESYWRSLFESNDEYNLFKIGFNHFTRLVGSIKETDEAMEQILHLYFILLKMIREKDSVNVTIHEIRYGIFNHKITLNNGTIELSFLIPKKHTLDFSYKGKVYMQLSIDHQIEKQEHIKWIERVKSANTDSLIRTRIYQNGRFIKELRDNSSKVRITYDSKNKESKIFADDKLYASRNENHDTLIYFYRDIYEGTEEKIYDSLMELLFIREHDCSGRSIYTKNILTGKENFMIIDESDIEKEMESYQNSLRD